MSRAVRLCAGFFLAAILVLAGCGSDQPGSIEGTVTSASSGDALPEARVVVSELQEVEGDGEGQLRVYQKSKTLLEELSDESGRFSFALEPETYQVEVWVEDVLLDSRLVEVKPGRKAKAEFSVTLP